MDDEKIERTMQFILEQQADSAVKQAEAKARVEQMERTMQFILDRQADAEVKREESWVAANARMERMERTMQFILDRQADAEVKREESQVAANAGMERMERAMQFILDRQAEADVRSQKIDEQLAVLTADVTTRSAETDRLHEDLLLLSSSVNAHHAQIQALTAMMSQMTGRVDKLAEIIGLTHDNGHDGRA
ncbi:MAG: hypothetical protein ACREBD_15725 [Blastocatellia bacterium]